MGVAMKFCEKCQCEYEDFADICVDCGNELIKYEDRKVKEDTIEEVDYLEVLKSCSSNEEANLLVSLLTHEEIYTYIRYEGAGSYLNLLHGRSYQGVQVLVPSKEYDPALEVLRAFDYTHNLSKDDFDTDLLRRFRWNKRLVSLFVLVTVLAGILVPFIFRLISIFQVHRMETIILN